MKTGFILVLAGMTLILASCTSSFLVYKDGRGYFVDGDSKAKYDMLCASGDMDKILAATTHLGSVEKDSLNRYNCSAERSSEKVKQLFASFTVEQRKDLKCAFRKNGYEINKLAC